METINKAKLITGLQSKINMLSARVREAYTKKEFCHVNDMESKITAFMEIQSAVNNGNFDA